MECVGSIEVVLYCDEIFPIVQSPFPEGGEMFEKFFWGIVLVCIVVVLSCRILLCLVFLVVWYAFLGEHCRPLSMIPV